MPELVSLHWDDFKDHVNEAFQNLIGDNDFADVTLACGDGQQIKAHKVILAASSPFFENLLKSNAHPHPLIFMRGVEFDNLQAIVNWLYCGETSVYQENLESFLQVAEEIQITGLMAKSKEPDIKEEKAVMKNRKAKVIKQRSTSGKSGNDVKEENAVENISEGKHIETLVESFQELDEKIMSLMEKGDQYEKENIYYCNVCGQRGMKYSLKDHIEAKHLEGISLPCNICEKVFKSRVSLRMHKSRTHKT